ncbi:LacI family DNA-binding transcriptional regulator [Puia sp. P3]|uniref:LacI family DNA-binding transcriptional regulator n=1 Tax=Puia sp. P3 TaxID=3423952 RepID=UPI003D679A9C
MIRCIKCGEVHAITKSGVVHGKQRYYCKDCRIYFSLPSEQESDTPVGATSHHSATILDIARALNISKSTVSRALQGHKDIREETRAAVLEMASRLDYQPNLLAKSLVRSKTFTIGIIVPEFMNSFFPTVIIGARGDRLRGRLYRHDLPVAGIRRYRDRQYPRTTRQPRRRRPHLHDTRDRRLRPASAYSAATAYPSFSSTGSVQRSTPHAST